MLCGFLMVPRALEAGGGCTVTMIVHTDLGGNLPAPILNRLSTSSPWRLVQRLCGAFQKTDSRPSMAEAAAAATAAATVAVAAAGPAAGEACAVSGDGGGGSGSGGGGGDGGGGGISSRL